MTACELLKRLALPLEALANLVFLTSIDPEDAEKVRLYMRFAEERMVAIRQTAAEICAGEHGRDPGTGLG
jgi:hypothetical protein